MTRHKVGWQLLAVALCVLFSGCDQNDQDTKATKETELIKRETALMSDPERAGAELEERLAENVKVDGNVVLVHTPGGILYVLPVTAPWTLSCFAGMSIVFGNSVTGDNSDTSNDVTVYLTSGQIDAKGCDVLGPRIGKRLQAMLGRDQPAQTH